MPPLGLLLLLAIIIEFLLFTFFRNQFGPYITPVIFLLSSFLVSILALHNYETKTLPSELLTKTETPPFTTLIPAAGLLIFIPRLKNIFSLCIIDVHASDVIPSIQIYVNRFLNNEEVYSYFHELGYKLYPTYLPTLWLPFTIAEKSGFDYRWLAVSALALTITTCYFLVISFQSISIFEKLIKLAIPFIFVQGIMKTDIGLFGYTVESLIIAYYLFFSSALNTSSSWLRAISLVLCLLSRFSLVLWIPLWLALIYQNEGQKPALKISMIATLLIIAIYIIPFLSKDWQALALGQETYLTAAKGEWDRIATETSYSSQLYQGIGFAAYFYEYAPGSILNKIHTIRLYQLMSCSLVIIVAAIYWRYKKPKVNYRLYSLVVLKFYIATFYAFIQVPYTYLTALLIFLSLPLLLEASLFTNTRQTQTN